MIDSRSLDALERAYQLENSTIIRYLLDNGVIQVRDDFDRKVRSFFSDWYRANDNNRLAFYDLIQEEGRHPGAAGYPLQYSDYHYLNAAYLLAPVGRLMADSLDAVAAIGADLVGWPRAKELVDAVVERERPFIGRAAELAAELAAEYASGSSVAPKMKGTSASRW